MADVSSLAKGAAPAAEAAAEPAESNGKHTDAAEAAGEKEVKEVKDMVPLTCPDGKGWGTFPPANFIGNWTDSMGHNVEVTLSVNKKNEECLHCNLTKSGRPARELEIWPKTFHRQGWHWVCGSGSLDWGSSSKITIWWMFYDGSWSQWNKKRTPEEQKADVAEAEVAKSVASTKAAEAAVAAAKAATAKAAELAANPPKAAEIAAKPTAKAAEAAAKATAKAKAADVAKAVELAAKASAKATAKATAKAAAKATAKTTAKAPTAVPTAKANGKGEGKGGYPSPHAANGKGDNGTPRKKIERVMHSWKAEDKSQMNVREGEFLDIWVGTETPQGWVYAEKRSGDRKAGWLPVGELQKLPDQRRWMQTTSKWEANDASQCAIQEGAVVIVWLDSKTPEGWVYAGSEAGSGTAGSMQIGWMPVMCLDWSQVS